MNKVSILDATKPGSNRVAELINRNIRKSKYSIFQLSDDLNISSSYLTRIFKEKLGVSPLRYMNEIKIAYAKEDLINTSTPIKLIYINLHSVPLYFSRIFPQFEGVSQINTGCFSEHRIRRRYGSAAGRASSIEAVVLLTPFPFHAEKGLTYQRRWTGDDGNLTFSFQQWNSPLCNSSSYLHLWKENAAVVDFSCRILHESI